MSAVGGGRGGSPLACNPCAGDRDHVSGADRGADCKHCGRPLDPFGRCRRRVCSGYFALWAGDTVAWVQANAAALDAEGRLDLVTLTAPGQDYLPWDRARCTHEAGVACSGKLGCVVHADLLARWNATSLLRLTALMNAAHTRAWRATGRPRPMWLSLPELQRRGALHFHFLFAARDRPYVVALVAAMRELAPLHVFGGTDLTKCTVRQGERRSKGAAYLYKTVRYVTKSNASGADSPERAELVALLNGPLMRRPFMRASPKLTTRTFATMRNLRYRRYLHSRARYTGGELQAVDFIRRSDAERRERETIAREVRSDLIRWHAKLTTTLPAHLLRERGPLALDQLALALTPVR